MTACPFCERIAAGDCAAQSHGVVTFKPPHPVTPGHLLVVPREHVTDAAAAPAVTAEVMRQAAVIAAKLGTGANLITSIGADATQTVFHLHAHVVPRRPGDGLALPWTGQAKAAPAPVRDPASTTAMTAERSWSPTTRAPASAFGFGRDMTS
jgi:histidine triad (HIT) family protein